jgi:hypothetical protein
MDIICPCGSVIKKPQLYRHLKSKKHLNYLSLKKEEDAESKPEEIKAAKAEIPIDDNKSQSSSDNDDTDDEADNQEVEELIVEAKEKKHFNKEHLDRIREKAHEVLKAKKMARIQAKLDKENELLNKARLYDELLIKQKQDEEQKKQEELNKIEMEKEKRLKDYDKILEENMRLKNKANDRNHIQEYAKQQIIDDLKQQRLQYLSRHLGINF